MTTRAARALRGAAFAAASVLLAAVAHTLSGGGAPSPLFCVVMAVLATPPAVLLAGGRSNAWRTATAVIVSQAVFHLAFTGMGDLGRWETAASAHVHGAASALGPVGPVAPLSIGMLLAHAAAAALSAVVVCRGESTVVAVWRWVRAHLTRSHTAHPMARVRADAEPSASTAFVVRLRAAASPLLRRGPPGLAPA